MQPAKRINRLANTRQGMEEAHLDSARTAISQARRTLIDHPCPDIFLGRKTQEPFPNEDDLQARLTQGGGLT